MSVPQLPQDGRPIWERIAELAEQLPAEVVARMPTDGASELDHYVYGAKRRNPMATNDGGAAFPGECGENPGDGRRGMSLLDWFAGERMKVYPAHTPSAELAAWCYQDAAAMLAERERLMKD